MKIDRKHMGLLVVSFIALSFNSHFAQAARKAPNILEPAKVYAFKKQGTAYHLQPEVAPIPVTVKKTSIKVDRQNLYIGGYVVNSGKDAIQQVRIVPRFHTDTEVTRRMSEQLQHDELNLKAGETRRFVIMRPIDQIKQLLEENMPLEDKCLLSCRVM